MRYEIYSKSGVKICDISDIEYTGEWMGGRSITLSVKHGTTLPLEVGSYVIYRNARYELNVEPSLQKSAKVRKSGESFVYENIKFDALTNDLVCCNFLDYVLYDNELSFVSNPNFVFHAETVTDLAERIQANLDRLYTGSKKWTIEVDDDIPYESSKLNQTVSVNNITCWDALKLAYDTFGCKFVVDGTQRKITINTSGNTLNVFKLGKNEGLVKLKKTSDESQGLVTRLRAYGNSKNMPLHYYYNKVAKVFINYASATAINNETIFFISPNIPTATENALLNRTPAGTSIVNFAVKLKVGNTEYNATIHKYTIEGGVQWTASINQELEVASSGKLYITDGVYVPAVDPSNKEGGEGAKFLPVQNLMLPGYPTTSLDPYLDSDNIDELGIREASVFFDGSNDDLDDIYPTIEGTGLDVVAKNSDAINDDGVFPEGSTVEPSTFKVYVPDLGFDIIHDNTVKISGTAPKINFTSGLLSGRDFDIQDCEKTSTGYTLTCVRQEDSSLNCYFPNSFYYAKAGDKYVFTEIYMPDSYVTLASNRLQVAAEAYLAENCSTKYKYEAEIDPVFMANQNRTAINENKTSYYQTIKEGDLLWLNDENLGIDNVIIEIANLTITEKDGKEPTYKVTLNDEKTAGVLQRIQETIKGITNGTTVVNGSGGGLSRTQIVQIAENAIENYKTNTLDKLYLRKDKDDSTSHSLSIGGELSVSDNAYFSSLTQFKDQVEHEDDIILTDGQSTVFANHFSATEGGIITLDDSSLIIPYGKSISTNKILPADDGERIEIEGIEIDDSGLYHHLFSKGIIDGQFWGIDDDGNAEFDSLVVRNFLEVPELKYNRVTTEVGTTWLAPGAGVIYDVMGNNIALKLEEGEVGSFADTDLCMGIWHFGSNNESASDDIIVAGDIAQGIAVEGFTRVYFFIDYVSDYYINDNYEKGTNGHIITPARYIELSDYEKSQYKVRKNGLIAFVSRKEMDSTWSRTELPQPSMAIVAFGNMYNTNRQSSAYSTKTFQRYLHGVNTWRITQDNYAMQLGDLSNLHVEKEGTVLNLEGYSAYLNNVYFSGHIEQLDKLGVQINYRGVYDHNNTYKKNDEVAYDNFLWVYNGTTETSAAPSEPTWSKIALGSGIAVTDIVVQYATSTQGTDPTAVTGWSSTIPAEQSGTYLWTRTQVTYTDSSVSTSYSIAYQGSNGNNLTVQSSSVQYQASNSYKTVPTGNWSANIPTVNKGQYLWTRTETTLSDGTKSYSYAISYFSKDGTEHTFEISSGGYWIIDGEVTTYKAIGDDGHSPYIEDDIWWEWNADAGAYQSTGIKAKGDDSVTYELVLDKVTLDGDSAFNTSNSIKAKLRKTVGNDSSFVDLSQSAYLIKAQIVREGSETVVNHLSSSSAYRSDNDTVFIAYYSRTTTAKPISCKIIAQVNGTEVDSQDIFVLHDGVDGEDGNDGVSPITLVCANQNISIPCNSSSKPSASGYVEFEVALYEGTTRIDGTYTIDTNTALGGGISFSGTYPNVKATWQSGQPVNTGQQKIVVTSGDVSRECYISINAIIPGTNGVTTVVEDNISSIETQYAKSSSSEIPPAPNDWSSGKPLWTNGYYVWQRYKYTFSSGKIEYSNAVLLQSQKVRMCGMYKSTETYVNNNDFLDIVLHNGNYFAPSVASVIGITPSTQSSSWQVFNKFDNIATSVLLANQGYIDVLGSGRIFVGQTAEGNGWEMTAGKIKHTSSGLELTADGMLKDPDGLHIKVGDNSLVSELKETGIDISNKVIELTADQLICKNNSNEKTMWLNEYGDLITSGIQQSLIQEINTTTNKNTRLLIDFTEELDSNHEVADYVGDTAGSGGKNYVLDVMNCGNILNITCIDGHLHLPYYISANNYVRSATRQGGLHMMTANEMKQMVGKRIVVYTHESSSSVIPYLYHYNSVSGASNSGTDIVNGINRITQFLGDVTGVQLKVNSCYIFELTLGLMLNNRSGYDPIYYWKVAVIGESTIDEQWN